MIYSLIHNEKKKIIILSDLFYMLQINIYKILNILQIF